MKLPFNFPVLLLLLALNPILIAGRLLVFQPTSMDINDDYACPQADKVENFIQVCQKIASSAATVLRSEGLSNRKGRKAAQTLLTDADPDGLEEMKTLYSDLAASLLPKLIPVDNVALVTQDDVLFMCSPKDHTPRLESLEKIAVPKILLSYNSINEDAMSDFLRDVEKFNNLPLTPMESPAVYFIGKALTFTQLIPRTRVQFHDPPMPPASLLKLPFKEQIERADFLGMMAASTQVKRKFFKSKKKGSQPPTAGSSSVETPPTSKSSFSKLSGFLKKKPKPAPSPVQAHSPPADNIPGHPPSRPPTPIRDTHEAIVRHPTPPPPSQTHIPKTHITSGKFHVPSRPISPAPPPASKADKSAEHKSVKRRRGLIHRRSYNA